MKWKKTKTTEWKAAGNRGTFEIRRSVCYGIVSFLGEYYSRPPMEIHFNMPPCRTISEAKEICEDSNYWEEE